MTDESIPQNPGSLADATQRQVNWRLNRSVGEREKPFELDPEQQRVVAHNSGPMLVLAGPGTGKTATLTEAVAARLTGDNALKPDSILVLTFARKAADEIRDRIVRKVGGQAPLVRTFHSLALGLIGEFDTPTELPQILTGPEQELEMKRLLAGFAEDGGLPTFLAEAAKTRGLAVEFRNAVARAQSLGLTQEELQRAAAFAGKPEWQAVAALLAQYEESLAQQGELDYNLLVSKAVELTSRPEVQSTLRKRFQAVFVDEYQDTDPLQIRLLHNLIGASASLIVVGDPDQAIYGFRGAQPRAIADFKNDFAYLEKPVQIVSLRTTRRFGRDLREFAQQVIQPNPVPAGVGDDYRQLQALDQVADISVDYFESAEVEAEAIAEKCRFLVLAEGRSWKDIAILVRSGKRSIPTLERALLNAGVPVNAAFDELPLAKEPAVATLLLILGAIANPDSLKQATTAKTLLTSPLARLTVGDLRRLSRMIRNANPDEPGWSETWLARALTDPEVLNSVSREAGGEAWEALNRLRALLASTSLAAENGASVHELLFALFSGTSWPEDLRRQALAGNSNSPRAERDLDAISSLMSYAAAESKVGRGSFTGRIRNFIELITGLEVSAQSRVPAYTPDAVSLLTAHRAKGLQWPVVFIASANEGVWPDLKRRSSLFEPDRLHLEATSEGLQAALGELPERSEVLAEERRLFYVACTRAQSALFISATSSDPESGVSPTRFLKSTFLGLSAESTAPEKLGEEQAASDRDVDRLPRYSPNQLIAQLRRLGTAAKGDEKVEFAGLLAQLAAARRTDGTPLFPAANPRNWWAVAAPTVSEVPVDPADKPVYVRGSSLATMAECSLKWFFQQRANASEASTNAMVFGNIVHAISQASIQDGLPADSETYQTELEKVWTRLRFEANWLSERELGEARACLSRLSLWIQNREGRLYAEQTFNDVVDLPLPDGSVERLKLYGRIDVLEVRSDNAWVVADLKTSSGTVPSKEKSEVNPQLGLYQYAVNRGVLKLSEVPNGTAGGAELVYLRQPPKAGRIGADGRVQSALPPSEPGDPNWLEVALTDAVEIVRSEEYRPTTTDCSRCLFEPLCPMRAKGKAVIS